jgi:molybdopterin-guanine dinucleotide biosynthesis protein A
MEPLAAIYTSTGLSIIHENCLTGKLPKHSMKYVLGILNTHNILVEDGQLGNFKNFNTASDLIGL